MRRRGTALITIAVLAVTLGMLMTGCGSKKKAASHPKTYPAYQAIGFNFIIDGSSVTLTYLKAPPSPQQITVMCADLGTNGYTNKTQGSGTWSQGAKRMTVTMDQPVGNRDVCAAQLGGPSQTVVTFLNAAAQKKSLADQAKQAKQRAKSGQAPTGATP